MLLTKRINKRHYPYSRTVVLKSNIGKNESNRHKFTRPCGYFLAFLPISYPILYAEPHKILAILSKIPNNRE
mgnify:CR=1 FL=1